MFRAIVLLDGIVPNDCPAIVGEDIILPRSGASQVSTLLGEFVQNWTRNHSTNHASDQRGGRLIASPTVAGHSFLLRRDVTGRGAPRSESDISMIAGGNHTIIYTQECDEYRPALCAIGCRASRPGGLRQHRIMGQGDSARDFGTSESTKNAGILDVFPIFRTARLGQKICRSPQSPLCGVALRNSLRICGENAFTPEEKHGRITLSVTFGRHRL